METLPPERVSKPGCPDKESAGTYEARTTSRLLGEIDLQKLSEADPSTMEFKAHIAPTGSSTMIDILSLNVGEL